MVTYTLPLFKLKFIIMSKQIESSVNNRWNFVKLKEAFQLDNKTISDIIGLTPGTVKNQISPSHGKVTTWMRGMNYMYNRQKTLELKLKQIEDVNRALIAEIKELREANLQES